MCFPTKAASALHTSGICTMPGKAALLPITTGNSSTTALPANYQATTPIHSSICSATSTTITASTTHAAARFHQTATTINPTASACQTSPAFCYGSTSGTITSATVSRPGSHGQSSTNHTAQGFSHCSSCHPTQGASNCCSHEATQGSR